MARSPETFRLGIRCRRVPSDLRQRTVAQAASSARTGRAVRLPSLGRLPWRCSRSRNRGRPTAGSSQYKLSDSRFANAFTCNGANKSPALNWSAPPAATRSLALILYDEDIPGSGFVHWVLFDLPPTALSLAETVPASAQLPDGSRQGRNDFGDLGYGGPCPLGHSQHHYIFVLFALDKKLNLPAGASRADVDTSMRGHVAGARHARSKPSAADRRRCTLRSSRPL